MPWRGGAGFFPDASVFCGAELGRGSAPIENPVLVVEVLSPSTRNFDPGDKLFQYKRIPSLRHILYVDSERLEARLYSRGEGELLPGEPLGLREIYGELEFVARLNVLALRRNGLIAGCGWVSG
jgi:Uma2 family endonuclease